MYLPRLQLRMEKQDPDFERKVNLEFGIPQNKSSQQLEIGYGGNLKFGFWLLPAGKKLRISRVLKRRRPVIQTWRKRKRCTKTERALLCKKFFGDKYELFRLGSGWTLPWGGNVFWVILDELRMKERGASQKQRYLKVSCKSKTTGYQRGIQSWRQEKACRVSYW